MGVSLTSPTTLTAPDVRTKLRHRLITIRGEVVERMARDRTDGGTLALLAGVSAATKAIETGEAPVDLIGGGRAVLADDGAAITPTRSRRFATNLLRPASPQRFSLGSPAMGGARGCLGHAHRCRPAKRPSRSVHARERR